MDSKKYDSTTILHSCRAILHGFPDFYRTPIINNYYKPGPQSPSNSVFVSSSYYSSDSYNSWGPAKWYIDGNVMEGNATATADNWSAVNAEDPYTLDDIRVDERIVTEMPYYKWTVMGTVGNYEPERYMIYDYETAEDAYNTVINSVGTINRDAVEKRIIEDVKTGTYTYTGSVEGKKGIIDVETDAEGFIDYSTDYTVPADTDGDGMPDEWETAHGLNPNVADQNTINVDGYTALEVYLNSLMGETMSDDFATGIGTIVNMERPEISYDRVSNTIHVSENALGSTLKVYSTDGQLLQTCFLSSSETSLSGLPTGMLLLRISGKDLCPRVLKVIK